MTEVRAGSRPALRRAVGGASKVWCCRARVMVAAADARSSGLVLLLARILTTCGAQRMWHWLVRRQECIATCTYVYMLGLTAFLDEATAESRHTRQHGRGIR
jgi:hypothetical protein